MAIRHINNLTNIIDKHSGKLLKQSFCAPFPLKIFKKKFLILEGKISGYTDG